MAKFQINYEALDQDENKKDGIPYEDFLEWIETVVFSFFAVILIFTFIVRQVNVDGTSMVPTLEDGDKLIVHHLFYTPQKGDIVIIDSAGLRKPIVKRVIATGGDTIDIDFDSGEVTVNGTVLQEEYINDLTRLDEGGQNYPVTVPSGYYFVMGDNRMNSKDSRSGDVGLIQDDEIMGKVIFRLWPASHFGKVE
ncbi:MAG: signal peptidase I [Oscillospiraceae bacterium]|nr:signal peptidase I [Oscillospiraceae bacterium]